MTNELIVYKPDAQTLIELRADAEHRTVWATQRQIADALNLTVQAVSNQVGNWKKQRGEQGVKRYLIPTSGGTQEVEHYNMTVIAFIGFRAQATDRVIAFQDWVGEQLDALMAQQVPAIMSTDPLEQLKLTVAILEQQRAQLTNHENRLALVEAEQATTKGGLQMMTVAGYAKWKGLSLSDGELSSAGRKCTAYSNANGYPIGKTPHTRLGAINTYHVKVLALYFSQRNLFEGGVQ